MRTSSNATEETALTEAEPLLVDAETARELLGRIGKTLFWELVRGSKQPKVPHVRLGDRVLFSVEDLRTWVRRGSA